MTDEKLKERITEAVEGLNDADAIEAWDYYCQANNYWDEYIEYNDPDELLIDCSPTEIIRRTNNSDYDLSDNYCVVDSSDGEMHSFQHVTDDVSPFDVKTLVDYIVENNEDCGILDLWYIFDELEEEEDGE